MDPRSFIEANLRLLPAPSVPEISVYTADPGSGLWRLLGRDNETPPYWAYHWAGGTVLARYILDRPEAVAGRRVMDLGTGSGIVAIAAARCGARYISAVDVDPIAIIAATLNAEANDVRVDVLCSDILDGPPPEADIVLVSDLFYADDLSKRVLPFAQRCRDAGIDVLIGDPGRAPLPVAELERVAEYPVADFGDARDRAARVGGVYLLK